MTANDYWTTSPHRYQVVIADSDVRSACEWLAEQGFNRWGSWRYHPFDFDRAVFEFVNKDTATLFKLRWL